MNARQRRKLVRSWRRTTTDTDMSFEEALAFDAAERQWWRQYRDDLNCMRRAQRSRHGDRLMRVF